MAYPIKHTLSDSTNHEYYHLGKIHEEKYEVTNIESSRSNDTKKSFKTQTSATRTKSRASNDSTFLPKIADQYVISDQYDLYDPSPSLDYLKEKYRLYMDWLRENDTNENQLNWYNYEKSVYLNENSAFRFMKNFNKKDISNKNSGSYLAK